MDKTESPIEQMAHLMGEVTEVAVAGQAAGLRLLAAEMQALSQMMPGLGGTAGQDATDAEIEADFDNMPV
ncbi:MAG: hypothetical protein E6Q73_03045 [Pseudorhodobacter sp.]|nr:MAG: hypothetical protein E6Q73_03045 [Pseudorhodobacter sp.]